MRIGKDGITKPPPKQAGTAAFVIPFFLVFGKGAGFGRSGGWNCRIAGRKERNLEIKKMKSLETSGILSGIIDTKGLFVL